MSLRLSQVSHQVLVTAAKRLRAEEGTQRPPGCLASAREEEEGLGLGL